MAISVFDYTDYRRFLKDMYIELKSKNPRFSYRYFNRLAGVSSSGFLKLVMDGKRNLAEWGIRVIAKGFKLGADEMRYFESLVKFNQAVTHEERDHFFRELTKHRRFLKSKALTTAQYHLFSDWTYPVIVELLRTSTDQPKTVEWLQQRLHPPVGLMEVKRAVRELRGLGLVDEVGGDLNSREAMLATPDEVESVAVANYHVQMGEMARRSILKEAPETREFSGLTIALSEEGFLQAKREIQEFRKKLHSLLEHEGEGAKSLVAQINLQLFKLTRGAPPSASRGR